MSNPHVMMKREISPNKARVFLWLSYIELLCSIVVIVVAFTINDHTQLLLGAACAMLVFMQCVSFLDRFYIDKDIEVLV